jgi:hypothetical protein
MSHRNTHYWLWFLLFGLIGGFLYYRAHNTLDSESIWLLASGLLGLVVGANWLNEGKFARPYDLIVGIIFAAAGVIGILHGFGVVNLGGGSGLISNNSILGLSLATFPALINTVLGLTSLNHGLKSK